MGLPLKIGDPELDRIVERAKIARRLRAEEAHERAREARACLGQALALGAALAVLFAAVWIACDIVRVL